MRAAGGWRGFELIAEIDVNSHGFASQFLPPCRIGGRAALAKTATFVHHTAGATIAYRHEY